MHSSSPAITSNMHFYIYAYILYRYIANFLQNPNLGSKFTVISHLELILPFFPFSTTTALQDCHSLTLTKLFILEKRKN